MRSILQFLILAFTLAFVTDGYAQSTGDFRSAGSGLWSASGTWQRYSSTGVWQNSGVGENSPGQVPGAGVAGGNVTILNTHTVTLDITNAVAIASLTIGSGASGILQFETVTSRTLTITGNLSLLTGGQFNVQNAGAQTGSVIVGGNLSNTGTITFRQSATRYSDITINGTAISGNGTYTLRSATIGGPVTNNSTSTINLNGSLTCNNTLTCSAGTISFMGGVAQSLNGTANPVFNNLDIRTNNTAVTVGGTIAAITVNGTFNIQSNPTSLNLGTALTSMSVAGSFTMVAGNTTLDFGTTTAKTVTITGNLNTTGIITMTGAGLAHELKLGGTTITAPSTFTTTAGSGSTVEYTGSGAQGIFASANYRNLKISGSGTKTFAGATTVNNNFDVTASGVVVSVASALGITGNMTVSGGGNTTMGGNSNTTTVTGSLLVTNNSTLIIGNTAGQVKTISVTVNVQVDNGSSMNNGAIASVNLLSMGGSLQVDGTFNMVNSFPNNVCNVTFTGAANNTISGTGATCSFNQITINKGVAITNILDVQRVITMSTPTSAGTFLTLTNGTFKLSSASSLIPYYGTATICAGTGKLWLNNSGASVSCSGTAANANPGAPTVTGTLQLTAGTFAYGSGNDVMSLNAATSNLTIDGGTLNMYGSVTFTSTSQLNFTSGNLNIDPQGIDNLPSTTTILSFQSTSAVNAVTFTGGTLTIVDPHSATGTGVALFVTPTAGYAYNFIGSTIRFGDGTSNTNGVAADGFEIDAGNQYALGSIALNNGSSSGSNRYVRLLNTNCTISDNLSFGSNVNDDLRLNGRALTLNGTVTPGSGIITGSATSSLSIGGNNTAAMTLPPISTTNLLSFTLNKTGTNAVVNLGSAVTLAAAGVLTLTSGVLEIGNYNLTLSNSTNGAIAGAANNAGNMISTNGTGYLVLNANKALASFVYPIGSGSPTRYYSPVTITGIGASTAGTVSIRAVSTSLGLSYINKYWDVLSSVARTTVTATFQYDAAEGNAAATTVAFSPGNPSTGNSMQTPPTTGSSSLGTNSFTVTGNAPFNGWWTVGTPTTYYTYQTGSWNAVSTWTTDPSGTLHVGGAIPAFNDRVVILSGRTVTLPANITTQNLDVTIQGGGFIDMGTYSFTNGFLSLAGQGTIQLASANFPTTTTNTFVNTGGGTTEYKNASGFTLPVAQTTYNNLTINAPGVIATQLNNLTLNGNLYINRGTFQINDNTTAKRQLTVNGNITVDNGASITVGTGVTNTTTNPALPIVTTVAGPYIDYYDNQSHRVVVYGDFTNSGTVRFTNLTYPVYDAFPATVAGATTGFATVYFRGSTNNFLTCNNTTDFYNLVLDKGSDQTYKLTIYASAYNYFKLFGANTAPSDILMGATTANPNMKKALWLRSGTLSFTGLTAVPSLTEGTAASTEYYIPSNAAMLLDGSEVVILNTADDYREVNVSYTVAGGTGLVNGVSKNGYNSLIVYGLLQVNDGYLSTRESGGIVTNSTASGQIIINGGVVDAKQLSAVSGSAYYLQTNGALLLRGRIQRTPAAYTIIDDLTDTTASTINTARAANGIVTTLGTFNLENTSNIFSISGGIIRIYDVSDNTVQEAFDVKSSSSNVNVTGGTVEFIPTTGTVLADATNYLVNTTASMGNVLINRVSGASTVQLSTNALIVLGNFNLNAGSFNASSLDLTIGGDLRIQSGTTFTTGTNTTKLNGASTQTFTVNLAAALSLNKFTISKTAGVAVNMAGSQTTVNVLDNFNLTLGTLNDNGVTFNVSKNVYNSGLHTGTGKISLNGAALTQTIDGNGIFQNLELNNTNAASAPVSLIANTTVNGALTFSQNKLFNIGIYNLRLNASATIVNGGALRYIQCAGNAGDGGVTRVYASPASFTFPVGAPSTNHAGVPNYTPATLGLSGVPTVYGSISVVPVGYAHPNETTAGRSLAYFWRVRSSGFTLGSATITHGYTYSVNDLVLGAGITENQYVAARFDQTSASWTKGTTSDLDITGKIIGQPTAGTFLNNVSFIDGDYTAGDDNPTDPFGVPLKFYSIATGRWTTNTTWSNTSGGAAVAAGAVAGVNYPGPNSIVYIEGNKTVTLNSATGTPNFGTTTANTDVQSCASLTIRAGSTLDIGYNPNSNFALLVSDPAGNGTIRMTTSFTSGTTFANPSGDFSDFNVNLGTTELYSTNPAAGTTYWLKNGVTNYGNLTISPLGGSNIIFPNNDLTIYGNCTINGQNADSWFCPTWNTNYPLAPTAPIAKTITINGNLDMLGGAFYWMPPVGGVAQDLVVNGNITVATTAAIDVFGAAFPRTLTIGGNLINNANGLVNAPASTTAQCNFATIPVTFNSSTSASISNTTGSPRTIFGTVTVNKGSSQATTLTCDIGGTLTTPTDNWLTIQNGTFRYMRTNPAAGANFTISTSTTFTIPSTGGLYVNMPSNTNNINVLIANNNADASDLILNGKLTVISGNVYVGPVAAPAFNNDIEYSGGGSSAIVVQGGNLYVNGQIRRPTTTTNGILSYTQSGGSVTINGNTSAGGAATAATRAKLEILNTGSQFNFSGSSTITIARGGGGTTFGDLYLRPQSSSVTGGTVIFTNVVPNTAQTYSMDANISLYNLTVTGAAAVNATVGLMVNPLTLNGSLTLTNARSIFNTNNINVTIKGDMNNSGTYNFGTNLTTFSGGAQNITGTSTTNFYYLNVYPVTSLTVNNSFTVNKDLLLGTGILTLGSRLLTLKGDLTNNANYSDNNVTGGISLGGTTAQQQVTGTGVYNRLELNNSYGARLNNDVTLQGDMVLTQGVLDINQYLLMLTQTSTIGGSGFSTSKMIKSDGVASNSGTRKFFNIISGATTFTFPVGITGKYTPATYNISNSATVGYIAVHPVNTYQPTVLDPNNVLQYYWAIESSGISGFTGDLTLQYLAADVMGTESNYVAAKLELPAGTWTKATVGPATDNVNELLHTILFADASAITLTGDYTAGDSAAIPDDVPTFETISNGNWTDNTIWVPVSPTVIPCPVGGPNGFNVIINHSVITNTNNCNAYSTTINSTGKLMIVSPTYGHNLGDVSGTGILYLENGNLPAGNFSQFFDCKFGGALEYGGSGSYAIIATAFTSIPKILISGTGTRVLPNKDLTICTQLKIDGSVTLDNSVNNKKLIIEGTMEIYNGGSFNSGTGTAPASTVTFAGSAMQSLGGPLGDFTGTNGFNNLELDNSNGLTIGTNGNIEVKNNLLLTSGLIYTTTANKLTLVNTLSTAAVPTGGSSTSFVDGPLIKQIPNGSSFLFPFGKGGVKSHEFTVTSGYSTYYTAEYFTTNSNPNSVVSPILETNSAESWSLSNNSAVAKNAKVKIAWDAQSDLTAAMTVAGASGLLTDMRVVEYNGSAWAAVGTSGTLLTSGTVTVGDVSSNTNVTISTTPKLYTTGTISNTVAKATFSPAGVVCGSSGIPVTFTTVTPITLNYTLNYTIDGIAQTPIVVSALPYTLPTLVAGDYQLTSFVYNGSTVSGRVDPSVISVYDNPNTATAGADQSLCGLSGTILTGNDPAPYTGIWSILSGLGGIVVSPTAYNSVFTGISGRTYTLMWTNDNSGCVSRDTVDISFPLLPSTPSSFTSAPSPVCEGSSGYVYAVPPVTGNTYTWTYTGTGETITGNGTNSVTVDFALGATSGLLKVTSSNSCGVSSARTKAVVVQPLPIATFSYTGNPYCNIGANPVPTYSGGGVAGTFSSTAGLIFVSTSTGEIDVATSTPGTYTVTNTISASGACGIVTATSNVVITRLGTWLGIISTDWFDPNNWGCTTVPTKLIDLTIPGGVTYMPVIAAAGAECKNLVIDPGASLTITGVENLDVWGDWTNNNAFIGGSGSVSFQATGTIGGLAVTTFNHLVIAPAGIVTAGISNIDLTGDWTNNGTFNAGTSAVSFEGTTAQSIGGTSPTAFYDLTINNAGNKITLMNDQSVSNALTMSVGNIVLGTYILALGNTATITGGSATSYIEADGTGVVKKFYNTTGGAALDIPVGDFDDYSPLTFSLNSGSTLDPVAFVTVRVIDSIHPNLGVTAAYITRYWELEPSGINTPDYDVTYTYKMADVVGIESSLVPCKYSTNTSPNWNYGVDYGVWALNTTTHTLSWSAVTSFSGLTGQANPGSLPIQLISFDAAMVSTHVNLNWITASETNNAYFTIEKTKDLRHYESVITRNGAGNSSSILKYSAIDESPYHGTSYYRLKQTDYNGTYTYSKNVAVSLGSEDHFDFEIFPNPNDGLTVNLFIKGEKSEKIIFVISDASGKIVYSETGVIGDNQDHGHTMKLRQKLQPGTYTIKGTNSSQEIFTRKLVVK